jgi:hypothetical protein
MHRLFSENEDISARIVSALYIKSAGDQTAVFKLLGIGIYYSHFYVTGKS